jgi:hypothetical protein
MHVDDWLRSAIADAEKRGLPQLKTLLESLARSTLNLRQADERLRKAQDETR